MLELSDLSCRDREGVSPRIAWSTRGVLELFGSEVLDAASKFYSQLGLLCRTGLDLLRTNDRPSARKDCSNIGTCDGSHVWNTFFLGSMMLSALQAGAWCSLSATVACDLTVIARFCALLTASLLSLPAVGREAFAQRLVAVIPRRR